MINWLKSLFINKETVEAENKSHNSHNIIKGISTFEKGNTFLLAKDFESAIKLYDFAIESSIKDAFKQRAICLQALEYHFEALDDFDIAINISSNDCNLYYLRTWSRIAIRDNEGALSDIKTAIELSKINNERNRIYNEGTNKSEGKSLTELYEMHLPGIEQMAIMNEIFTNMNKPLEVKRRVTN